MRIFTLIVSIISIVITVLPTIKTSLWWIRIFDYPRLQIVALCLISIVLIFIYLQKGYRRTVLFALVFLSFIYQLFFIIPYTSLYPVQAQNYEGKKNNSSFIIIEANIKMDNKEVEKFLGLISESKPDILVITEPNKWWEEKTHQLNRQFPYSIKKPLENTYGMIMYSKFPLKKQEINFLVKDDIPSFYAKVILPNKKEFDLYTLHPEPPKPGASTYDRDTEILIVGRRIRNLNRPAVVVGDLNDVGWSHTSKLFQKYSRMLDPRKGRGLFNTYNVFIPLFRYPLDHFFYSKHFGFIKLEKLKAIGSDHYPMLIEINLESKRSYTNYLPPLDKEDKKEVKETINQENK